MMGHEYVRDYMKKLDSLDIDVDRREAMVQTMMRVYELTETLMDEAQALQPSVVRAPKPKSTGVTHHVQHFGRKVTQAQLRAMDGSGGGAGEEASIIWLSVGGRVLDATGSASYGPCGAYSLFAGREITKCLAEMSLDPADLDVWFDPSGTEGASTWAAKLGAAYPCVGTLAEYPVALRLPEILFAFDPSSPLDLERPVESEGADASEGSAAAACPITGAQGAACPLGFKASEAGSARVAAASADEECPFPFIFLHDPKHGWELHKAKVMVILAGGVAMLATVVARAF
jgi:membrane-associated progesterone receptor component